MKRQDWETAISVQSEILAMMAGPQGQEYRNFWLMDRYLKYGEQSTLPCKMAFDSMVEDLIAAEPLWVTPEMHDLTLSAMETFNAREPMIEEDVLFPCGFAVLPTPFAGKDVAGNIAVFRCIHWRMIDTEIVVEDSDGNRQEGWHKCMKVTLWSNIDDKDDYTNEWMKSVPDKWGILHTTVLPLLVAHDLVHTKGEGDVDAQWVTYIRVLHRLMSERIVTSNRYRPSRPARREAQRRGMPDVRDVVVVELRRVSVSKDEEPGEAHYSHRFMVRGHWRNQWYPSLKVHRQKWVHGYVKGPEDQELVLKERVWVWDR